MQAAHHHAGRSGICIISPPLARALRGMALNPPAVHQASAAAVDIGVLQAKPENENAMFQVASNLNAVEGIDEETYPDSASFCEDCARKSTLRLRKPDANTLHSLSPPPPNPRRLG